MDIIKIKEYSALRVGNRNGLLSNGYTTLDPKTFDALEQFILNCKTESSDAIEVMTISARKGVGKVLTAKNYVGIITLKNGTTIEILPKLYTSEEICSQEEEGRIKGILIKMLCTLYDIPGISLQTSNLQIASMPLLEVFIRMFVDEVTRIVRQGLKSNYETVEENALFYKGKLNFAEHIRKNFAHRERNYIRYDAFTVNRPENRILKTALQLLYLHTRSGKNKKDIKNLLNIFDEVDISGDYLTDFAKIVSDRNTKGYTTALAWAKVFLSGKSFTSFSGSQTALALLFPMDRLFESYIASLVKRNLAFSDYRVSTQHTGHYLFDSPKGTFRIRPDIVITRKSPCETFVLDTKWKLLDQKKPHYNISQGDMYQMYVYQKKYQAKSVTLLYPKTNAAESGFCYTAENSSVVVNVRFIDMFCAEESTQSILGEIFNNKSTP